MSQKITIADLQLVLARAGSPRFAHTFPVLVDISNLSDAIAVAGYTHQSKAEQVVAWATHAGYRAEIDSTRNVVRIDATPSTHHSI